MTLYWKRCPRCFAPSASESGWCAYCGHQFRTQRRPTWRQIAALGGIVALALLLALNNPSREDYARWLSQVLVQHAVENAERRPFSPSSGTYTAYPLVTRKIAEGMAGRVAEYLVERHSRSHNFLFFSIYKTGRLVVIGIAGYFIPLTPSLLRNDATA